jgi:hypothetical protein
MRGSRGKRQAPAWRTYVGRLVVAKNPSGKTPSAGAATNFASGAPASGAVSNAGGVKDEVTVQECQQTQGRVQAMRVLRFKTMRRAMRAPLGIVLALGCNSASLRSAQSTPPAASPTIERVRPDSGPAGPAYPIEVTIDGRNFSDTANVIVFGAVTLRGVPSRNLGTRIVIFIPKEMPSQGEVPPSPLLAGAYDIRVTTAAGTSNAVTFRLTGSAP